MSFTNKILSLPLCWVTEITECDGYLQNNNEIIIFMMVEIKLLIELIMLKVNIAALPSSPNSWICLEVVYRLYQRVYFLNHRVNHANKNFIIWREFITWTLEFLTWTLEFLIWTLEFLIWTLEFLLWTLEFLIWILEFLIWTLEFLIRTLEFITWILEFLIWTLEFLHWTLDFLIWTLEFHIRTLEFLT